MFMAAGAFAHDGNLSFHGDDCSPRRIRFGDEETFVKQEVIEAGHLPSLKASVTHAPISVRGGNASGYTITVCKAAAFERDLDAIRVALEGGELKAYGPPGRDWSVIYNIRAPHGANIEVTADNGPISIRDLDGTVVARATNGPLSLKDVRGNVDATTKNGPISISGGAGTVKAQATNGPLSIRLAGSSWEGGTLDASTKNGPLTLKLPRGYASGVVVESNGRGPISCKADDCGTWRTMQARGRGWYDDSPQRIELGRGPAVVHLSTVNGPVSVKDE